MGHFVYQHLYRQNEPLTVIRYYSFKYILYPATFLYLLRCFESSTLQYQISQCFEVIIELRFSKRIVNSSNLFATPVSQSEFTFLVHDNTIQAESSMRYALSMQILNTLQNRQESIHQLSLLVSILRERLLQFAFLTQLLLHSR